MTAMKLIFACVCFAVLINVTQQAKSRGKKREPSSYDDCPLNLNDRPVRRLRPKEGKPYWFANPVGGNASLVHIAPESTSDLPDNYPSGTIRNTSSVLYAYTRECTRSYFHKLRGMESISYLRGGTLKIHVLDPVHKNMTTYMLGPRQRDGFTAVIPREHYLVSTLRHNPGPGKKFAYSLMSVTLVPANVYPDDVYEPTRKELLQVYGEDEEIRDVIINFTPEPNPEDE